MGFFIRAGLVKYKFTFTGSEIYNIGSSPISLATAPGFMPINCSFNVVGSTVPFDFGLTAYPAITSLNLRTYFIASELLDNMTSPDIFYNCAYSSNINHPTLSTTGTLNTEFSDYLLTTLDGSDATAGDGSLQIFLSGYFL